MRPFKHYHAWYYYTKSQLIGLLLFVLFVLFLQVIVCNLNFNPLPEDLFSTQPYLTVKGKVDSIAAARSKKIPTIYTFNPNFITDFRGLQLELTTQELDRLFSYRKQNKFIHSVHEFQKVTQVSDVWIAKYGIYFKFPAWDKNKRVDKHTSSGTDRFAKTKIKVATLQDINKASEEDLQKVFGIGAAYSSRIINERTKYGGYVSMEQLRFIHLPDLAVDEVLKHFEVITFPAINKVNINLASIAELKELPYLNYYIAREIVKYRSMEGDIVNKNDLNKIANFPVDKIDIISLYLDF